MSGRMAECYEQEEEDRYRLLQRRYRPTPSVAHRPDDEEQEIPLAPVAAASVVPSAAHLFGGSFQFIVQEQAKSMVAIQVF